MKEPVFVTPFHSDLGFDYREEFAIIGGGHMGADIARELDRYCILRKIHIVDIKQEQLDKARERLIQSYFEEALERFRGKETRGNEFMARMEAENVVNNRYNFVLTKDGRYEGLENVSLIIEAASEGAKKAVYGMLANSQLKSDVVIGTNTSAVLPPEIELYAGPGLEGNIVGSHGYTYFSTNPLIDVNRNKGSNEVLKRMLHIADKMGKKSITHDPNHSFYGSTIFEAAAAIAVEAVQNGERIEDVDRIFEALGFREGPLKSSDRTQHFAYIGCGKVLEQTLPKGDRTRKLYEGESHVKDVVKKLRELGFTGLESEEGKGFYQWDKPGNTRAKFIKAYRPEQNEYTDVTLTPDQTIETIEREDQESGYYRTVEGIVKLVNSDTEIGKKARKYGIRLLLEQIDKINNGVVTPGQAYATVRIGLVSKLTPEVYDKMGKEKFLEVLEKTKNENPDEAYLYEIDPDLLPEKLLEYGRLFNTPISSYNNKEVDAKLYPSWEISKYTELVVEKNVNDGIAVLTIHNPASSNPVSMELLDQLDNVLTDIESDERMKSLILTLSGEAMRGSGADIYTFFHGKFERGGKNKLSVEKALALSEKGREVFKRIKELKKFKVMAFSEVYGGVAELFYNCDAGVMLNGNSSQINQPEFCLLGIGDGLGGYANLKDRCGEEVAMSVFLGGKLDQMDARALGLVDVLGSNRLETIAIAYKMAKKAAAGQDVKGQLIKNRASRDRSFIELRNIDIKPGDSITKKAKELKMSPQALRRLLEKRDHYHHKAGIDDKYETDSLKETFVEQNALEGLSTIPERRQGKANFDTSEEIVYGDSFLNKLYT